MTLYSSIHTAVKPLQQILCPTKPRTIPLRMRSWVGLGCLGIQCSFRSPGRWWCVGTPVTALKKHQFLVDPVSRLPIPCQPDGLWPPAFNPRCTCYLESLVHMENHWRKEDKPFSTMDYILWDIHKHILWAVFFLPSPIRPLSFSCPKILSFMTFVAKLYKERVCAIMGATKPEHISAEETSLP